MTASTAAADLATLLAHARRGFTGVDEEDAEPTAALMALYGRADTELLAAAIALLDDPDPAGRCLGAALLGQMGGTVDDEDEDEDEDADEDDAESKAGPAHGYVFAGDEDDDADDDDADDDEGADPGDSAEQVYDSDEEVVPVFAAERGAALAARYAVETEPRVLGELGNALGQLRWTPAVPLLLARAADPVAAVRFGVVMGLMSQDAPEPLAALVALSADADDEVRNWATFALGAQSDADDESVRSALRARLTDTHPDTRGEALLGLARRGDPSALPAVEAALRAEDEISVQAVEAAIELADPRLHAALLALRADEDPEITAHFQVLLDEAIARCDPDAEI